MLKVAPHSPTASLLCDQGNIPDTFSKDLLKLLTNHLIRVQKGVSDFPAKLPGDTSTLVYLNAARNL